MGQGKERFDSLIFIFVLLFVDVFNKMEEMTRRIRSFSTMIIMQKFNEDLCCREY